ncbi:MAG: Rha family transcriptional regulator [Desulfatibacillum sp.]|nr:Rha family transcriptional regulator [Desulfatibacillum sp.]
MKNDLSLKKLTPASTAPLVSRKQTTTSLILAEKFGKEHKDVLRAIQRINETSAIKDFTQRNFALSHYVDRTGRKQPMYEIARGGFMLTVMGFTGEKALAAKVKFIEAYDAMEALIKNLADLLWLECRNETKQARGALTDTIKEFVAYSISQGSRNPQRYFISITRMVTKTLFGDHPKIDGDFRDTLSKIDLNNLAIGEHATAQALLEGITQGLHYKEVYRKAKDRLTVYASSAVLGGSEQRLLFAAQ